MSNPNGKIYPYTSFNFIVEIDNVESAGFSELSGLSIETETEEVAEGGINTFVHKLPKRTKYGNITLKKGMTNSADLYNWYMDIVKGKIIQKELGIVLLDETRQYETERWQFQKAYPVKWVGPELNASSTNIAFESIEVAHSGLSKI